MIGPGREIYFVVLVGGAPPSDCHSVTGRNAKGGPETRGRAKKRLDPIAWLARRRRMAQQGEALGNGFPLFPFPLLCALYSFLPLRFLIRSAAHLSLSLSARLHFQMSPKKKRSAIFCSLIEMESVGPWTSNCCLPLAPNGIRNDMDARRWMMGPRPLTVEPI